MSEQRVVRSLPQPQAGAPSMRGTREGNALRWAATLLALAAAVALVPFWAPLLLASWGAIIAAPLQRRLAHFLRRPRLAAGLITALLVFVILLPVAIATLSLAGSAITLGQRLVESKTGAEALKTLSSSGDTGGFDFRHLDLQHVVDLARKHGATALGAARTLFGAAGVAVIGLVVFVAGFYTFLTEGKQAYAWLIERSPLSHAHFHRLANVFAEVGRGLLIGVGLTALSQGAVATVGYLATGVPQAWVLGLVTVFASLIPSVGSGLVWAPVTVGLALTGRTGAAVAMLVIGLFVSVVDNLLRPLFARFAELRMHALILFLAMLGGIVVFGTWGLLLGPLLVRWATEGLTMLREQRAELSE